MLIEWCFSLSHSYASYRVRKSRSSDHNNWDRNLYCIQISENHPQDQLINSISSDIQEASSEIRFPGSPGYWSIDCIDHQGEKEKYDRANLNSRISKVNHQDED